MAQEPKGAAMRVIIVGGGLMGTASAFFLTRAGAKVTLIERDRIGQGATVASFGNIRRQGRYLRQLPLALLVSQSYVCLFVSTRR